MQVKIKILNDLYKLDEEGNEFVAKTDIITKAVLNTEDLIGPIQMVSHKTGKIYKTRCVVWHKDLGKIHVKHTFEEMNGWINPIKRMGFIR